MTKLSHPSGLAPVLEDPPPEVAVAGPVSEASPSSPDPAIVRPWWRRPWVVVAVLLVAAFVATRFGGGDKVPPPSSSGPVAVRAVPVERGDLAIRSSYSGELVGEVADVAPQVSGLLQDVPVRVGDHVRRGDVVATVDDVDLRNQYLEAKGQLGVAEANAQRAAAELKGSGAEFARSEELYGQELISDQEFDRISAQYATLEAGVAAAKAQVEQSRARLALLEEQLSDTRVRAPFDGTVAGRYLDRGALVQPNTPILRIVEDAPLLVQFRVPERDLAAVRPGSTLTVTTQVSGSEPFVGRVLRVSGEVSRSDRTVLVEGELTQEDELLLPGMYAEVIVRMKQLEGEVLVPGAAVLERVAMGGSATTGVFVAREEKAAWVDVEVLGRSGDLAAIRGDLEVGDQVLTLGHTELADGAAIRVVESPGSAETAAPGAAR